MCTTYAVGIGWDPGVGEKEMNALRRAAGGDCSAVEWALGWSSCHKPKIKQHHSAQDHEEEERDPGKGKLHTRRDSENGS